MAQTLQYKTTAQRARIQTSSAGIHHPVAGKANHELTFKPDQSVGADHCQLHTHKERELRCDVAPPEENDPRLTSRMPKKLNAVVAARAAMMARRGTSNA
jgi:hypothetical protein